MTDSASLCLLVYRYALHYTSISALHTGLSSFLHLSNNKIIHKFSLNNLCDVPETDQSLMFNKACTLPTSGYIHYSLTEFLVTTSLSWLINNRQAILEHYYCLIPYGWYQEWLINTKKKLLDFTKQLFYSFLVIVYLNLNRNRHS